MKVVTLTDYLAGDDLQPILLLLAVAFAIALLLLRERRNRKSGKTYWRSLHLQKKPEPQ